MKKIVIEISKKRYSDLSDRPRRRIRPPERLDSATLIRSDIGPSHNHGSSSSSMLRFRLPQGYTPLSREERYRRAAQEDRVRTEDHVRDRAENESQDLSVSWKKSQITRSKHEDSHLKRTSTRVLARELSHPTTLNLSRSKPKASPVENWTFMDSDFVVESAYIPRATHSRRGILRGPTTTILSGSIEPLRTLESRTSRRSETRAISASRSSKRSESRITKRRENKPENRTSSRNLGGPLNTTSRSTQNVVKMRSNSYKKSVKDITTEESNESSDNDSDEDRRQPSESTANSSGTSDSRRLRRRIRYSR